MFSLRLYVFALSLLAGSYLHNTPTTHDPLCVVILL